MATATGEGKDLSASTISTLSFDAAIRSWEEDGAAPGAYLARTNGSLALRLVESAAEITDTDPSAAYLRGAADVLRTVGIHLQASALEQLVGETR